MRLVEALTARDHAVYRMEGICSSLHQKESTITRLLQEKAELEAKLAAYAPAADGESEKPSYVKEIERLHALNKDLKSEIEALKRRQEADAASKENDAKVISISFARAAF